MSKWSTVKSISVLEEKNSKFYSDFETENASNPIYRLLRILVCHSFH